MRLAARARYCKEDERGIVRRQLLAFFSDPPIEVVTPARCVEELPYHMMQVRGRRLISNTLVRRSEQPLSCRTA
eukprot:5798549-Prymnesium_polylepis.1